ncbi:MAG: hypothetical protein ACLTKI_08880, partial [Lachnospiraceae bacterium]
MKKGKGLIVIIGLSLVLLAVTVFLGVRQHSMAKETFVGSGYILEADAEARSQRILVGAGNSYQKKKVTGELVFKDETGKEQTLSSDTFIHYDDGSMGATADGILLNLDDVSGNLINHYTIQDDMLMQTNGSQFSVSYDDVSLEFQECLWKISDQNYMLRSPEITLHFGDDDVRPSGDNLQVRYIDGGVVQMLTEENVWHTISPDVYAQTQSGVKFHLSRQMVEKDGNKFFVSKLTNSANEAVTLPEEEQNNLAVPEISIAAVDGKNGEAGEDGVDGQAGVNGISGSSGEDGIKGEDGEDGEEGSNGGTGENGEAGAAGATGNKGNTGSGGDIGDTGYQGNKGGAGLGVEGDSSSKTALPVMTFSEWQVTATGISGSIQVEDERNILRANTGQVLVVEVGNEEKALEAQVTEEGIPVDGQYIFDFTAGSESYGFMLEGLKPDTEYKVMVTSEYEMNDNEGNPQIYKRDFIIRSFYTSSVGAYLEAHEQTETSLSFDIVKQNYSSASQGKVYLLDESQYQSGFDVEKATLGEYEVKEVDFQGEDRTTVLFEKLEANHTYAAYLLIGQNLEANLIGDPCQIMTLKHKLVFDTDEKISVTINRQKGAFEVYRPKVEDVDGGLVKYIFEAIDETGTVVRTVEAAPGGSDVATFYVDGTAIKAGEDYKFRVKCLFDDNQKEVEYTIGQESDFLSAPTNTIPAIEWKPSDTGHTGPADIAGNIIIHTGNATLAKPSKDTPIRLHILADGIYESELVLYEETDVTWDTSQVVVRVNQSHLSENTTYRVAVYAWIDGEETQLGYVTFATRKLTTFRAVWGETGDTSHAVSQSLYLKPVDAQGNDLTDQEAITRAEYDMKTVAKIQLTLYRGTGAGKTPIKSIEHNNANGDEYDSSLAAEFFDEQNPIELDEGDFELSSGSLSDSLAYTLEVTAAYDYTVDKLGDGSNLNGYTNEYNVLDRAATVTKTMVPPELPAPDAAHRAVQVKELYNKDAVKYGAVKDENLPDDTVIGYQLTATYDNSYSLAREITYYVYEAYAYKTAEKGNGNMVYQDAMEGGDNAAFSYSQSVSAYTATIPSLIVLFGKGEPSYYDGTRVVYAGEAIYEPANKKLKGMDRGYQYVFAYTVKYSPSGTGSGSINYPFEMEDYKDYAQSGVYALNSGIWKAPRCNPTFYTYPESSNGQILTLNYYYTDGDNTIISEASTNQTKIMIDNQNASAEIGGIGPERTWNQVNLTQTNVPNQNVIFSPWLDYKIYELSYGDMPDVFDPIPRYYMGHFPVEYVDPVVKAAVPQIKVEMETDNIERNELVFRLSAGGLSSGVFQEAVNRIAALKVTFTRTTGGDDNVTLVKYLYVDPNSLAARISTSELDKLVGTA